MALLEKKRREREVHTMSSVASSSSSIRSSVLSTYKIMLKLSATIPDPKVRTQSLRQIREQFRTNQAESDKSKIEELLKKASSSLGYIKMISPKVKSGTQTDSDGVTRLTFGVKKDAKGRKAVSSFTGSNLDPDMVARHYAGLKRAGFKDNNHAKGGLF